MVSALVPPLLVIVSASPSQAAPVQAGRFTSVPGASLVKQVATAKSPTSRMAKTDPSLLNRTDSTQLSIAVKLDYDSTATYSGGIAGYEATSPSVTGKELSGSTAEQRYESRITGIEDKFLAELKKQIPSAMSVRSYERSTVASH